MSLLAARLPLAQKKALAAKNSYCRSGRPARLRNDQIARRTTVASANDVASEHHVGKSAATGNVVRITLSAYHGFGRVQRRA
jgi:hypothetical protein